MLSVVRLNQVIYRHFPPLLFKLHIASGVLLLLSLLLMCLELDHTPGWNPLMTSYNDRLNCKCFMVSENLIFSLILVLFILIMQNWDSSFPTMLSSPCLPVISQVYGFLLRRGLRSWAVSWGWSVGVLAPAWRPARCPLTCQEALSSEGEALEHTALNWRLWPPWQGLLAPLHSVSAIGACYGMLVAMATNRGWAWK